MAKRSRYYVDYPRDFANEYTVYATDAGESEAFEMAFPGAAPIDRAEAIHLGWTRPREAGRNGEQWFGGFAGDEPAGSLAEALEGCRKRTVYLLRELFASPAGH